MTKIKLCGLRRAEDIAVANELTPEFIGFIFAKKSRRYVAPNVAAELKNILRNDIQAVGVFVNENINVVAEIAAFIDIIQLHGTENENYIATLKNITGKPIIKAFRAGDLTLAENCTADYVMIDSGAGTGETFDWQLLKDFKRPYFLAGGLNIENVHSAIEMLKPFAVDVSSGIETGGVKDIDKMREFVRIVRS